AFAGHVPQAGHGLQDLRRQRRLRLAHGGAAAQAAIQVPSALSNAAEGWQRLDGTQHASLTRMATPANRWRGLGAGSLKLCELLRPYSITNGQTNDATDSAFRSTGHVFRIS